MGKKGKQSKKKGKKARKGRKHETVPASKNYTIKDGAAVRIKKSCPRCGQGTFLAQHKNRATCGRCGYTVIEKKV